MKGRGFSAMGLTVLMFTVLSFSVWAVPPVIQFQGRLTNDSGRPVTDPFLPMTFGIYDAQTDGSLLWEEEQTVNVQRGIYSIGLGSGTTTYGSFDPSLFLLDELWLEVAANGEVLVPRMRITSVGYAMKADNAEDADTLDGHDSTHFATEGHTHTFGQITGQAADGQIPALITRDSELSAHAGNGSAHHTKTTSFAELVDQASDGQIPSSIARDSEIVWANLSGIPDGFADGIDNDSGGTITQVTAGTGLSGGGASGNVSLGVAVPLALSGTVSGGTISGTNANSSGHGVYGFTSSEAGTVSGVHGRSASTSGRGVYGYATAATGTTYGLRGDSVSTSGRGVYGLASAAIGTTYGVYGRSASTSGRAIYGYAPATSGTTYGVYGENASTSGLGVYGYATATTGLTYGVRGVTNGNSGRAVYGWASSGTGETYGVRGGSGSNAGTGVSGYASASSGTTYGVHGQNDSNGGYGVYGHARASGGTTYGVYGKSDSLNGCGVYGSATNSGSGITYGGYFESQASNGYAVYGYATGTKSAIHAESENGDGIFAVGYGGNGGVFFGYERDGVHAEAYAEGESAIYGNASAEADYAGYFSGGNVYVLNHLIVNGSKAFVQPHPSDPSKEIVYACLEGGENGVYVRGTAELEGGIAEIDLPEHFALVASENGITVQLTPLDSCRGLFVAEKSRKQIVVMENQGGTGDLAFDYLVMGVRRGFEEHEVIRENKHVKPDHRISQEEYEAWAAQPRNRGRRALLIENGTLTNEGRVNEETASRLGWKLGPRTEAERMAALFPERAERGLER